MYQPLTLSIPQPCHESWDQMTPATQGRHCSACAKVVVDFTLLSDAEVVAYLSRTAAPCGRFREDQLQRVLWPLAEPASRWRTWLAAAVTVLGLRELAAEQSVGQQLALPAELPTYDQRKLSLHFQTQAEAVAADTINVVLRGQVTDASTGDGLPGAQILVQGTVISTFSRSDGTFELLIPASFQSSETTEVSISFILYESQIIRFQEFRQLTAPITIKLEASRQELSGEVIVVGYYPKPKPLHPHTLWNQLRNAFQR